ncbi:MAG: hypothetical protein KF873_01940 [Gemmataceae bacterium]|nr:hypothetical protein [Gemmataceae bacterium]
MLHVLAAVFSLAYAGTIADLGSDRFDRREAASRRLERLGPIGIQLYQFVIDTTPSAESRHRAERARERAIAAGSRYVERSLRLADAAAWDAAIEQLVDDEHEADGLPWPRSWAIDRFVGHEAATEALARAIARGKAEGWIDKDRWFACEVDCPYAWPPPGTLYGLGDVRFARRGLPLPTDWTARWGYAWWWPVRIAWAAKKAARLPGR